MLPAAPTSTFPYRILAKVGEGAMGEVYRAEDIELGRQIAIKVVKPGFLAGLSERDARGALQRFIQEARAAAAFSHPGVTTVHRVGTEAGRPYIAMEWLEGRPLDAVLAAQKRLPVAQAARLGLQVLAVLDAAHRAGVVHRDVKPGNIMVTSDRRIKVTDFGVARMQGSALAQTQVGLVLGTPQYAAPEQLAGRSVDGRADLYSLGAVLYEAVTGRPPIEAASIHDLMRLVQSARPVPASEVVAGLPHGFDAFLARALAKDPGARFSSAAEMARALQPFLTTGSQPPGPPPPDAARAEAGPAPVATVCVDGIGAAALVTAAVRQWPATALRRQGLGALLERLLETPLHAPAFSGALEVPGTLFLIFDGVVYTAFDPETGVTGDRAIEALPEEVDGTLHACPPGLDPRVVPLLASLIVPGPSRLSGLEAAFVDVPRLAVKLASEGFDGIVRLERGPLAGFVLFSRGRRVLELFGRGWPRDPASARWETWLGAAGAIASVEDRRTAFPAITYRRLLRELELDVVRARRDDTKSLRSDTRADAEALQLRPPSSGAPAVRAESTLHALIEADPAVGSARWVLVDLAPQFEQFRRTSRWRAMLEPLDRIDVVRLHHSVRVADDRRVTFDAATFARDGSLHHLVDRVALGTREAVEEFISRVVAAKQASGPSRSAVGALLIAPRFTEEALGAYLGALRAARGRSIRSALELLSHREGYLATEGGGCHVLLVEEVDGRRRPLVPEQ